MSLRPATRRRQRPHTAKGVTFITLEDETGFVNLVVWQDVWEKHRLLARSLMVMGVTGRIQAEDGVTHIVVDRIWAPRLPQEPAAVGSRDFQPSDVHQIDMISGATISSKAVIGIVNDALDAETGAGRWLKAYMQRAEGGE